MSVTPTVKQTERELLSAILTSDLGYIVGEYELSGSIPGSEAGPPGRPHPPAAGVVPAADVVGPRNWVYFPPAADVLKYKRLTYNVS